MHLLCKAVAQLARHHRTGQVPLFFRREADALQRLHGRSAQQNLCATGVGLHGRAYPTTGLLS